MLCVPVSLVLLRLSSHAALIGRLGWISVGYISYAYETGRNLNGRYRVSDMKLIKSIRTVVLGFLLACVIPAGAGVDDAVQAYLRGEFDKAAILLRPVAEQGNAQAQTYMGILYEQGEGVPQDYAESVKWYRLAAEQGMADAQYYLGNMYRNGNGVPKDEAEAVVWYTKAAEQGKAAAQNSLGELYARGKGSVKRDYVASYMWFNVAATSGNEPYVKGRDKVAKKMNKQEIEEAQQLSREWMETHQQ
jgi:TPR repeat protein